MKIATVDLPPPDKAAVPLPPTSLPEGTRLVETAQNNLIWALLATLAFVGLLVGGLSLLYIRGVEVPEAFTTIVATITGGAMIQIGKIVEAVSQLLVVRQYSNGDKRATD